MRLRALLIAVALAAVAFRAGQLAERYAGRPGSHVLIVEYPHSARLAFGPRPYIEAERLARRHAAGGARAGVVWLEP